MQNSQLVPDGETSGCGASRVQVKAPSVISCEREQSLPAVKTVYDALPVSDKALMSPEANNKMRIGLEKQCAVVNEESQEKQDETLLMHSAQSTVSASDVTQAAANQSRRATIGLEACSAAAAVNAVSSGAVSKLSENANGCDEARGKAATRDMVGPVSPAVSVANNASQQMYSNADARRNAQLGSVLSEQKEVQTTKCPSSGILMHGSVVATSETELPPSSSSGSSTLSSGSSSASAASRRSSFFNEPSRAKQLNLASQPCTLLSNRMPSSIVSERAQHFERFIARKGGIEAKSRSLDPAYTCSNSLAFSTSTDGQLSLERQLMSATPYSETGGYSKVLEHDDLQGSSCDVSSPECVWVRRASKEPFADAGFKDDASHDSFAAGQNSKTPDTPASKSGNLQKLKAFFGETTPRIIEAKGGSRSYAEEAGGENSTNGLSFESKHKDYHGKCDAATAAAQKSLTFDPASWALERMARGKKAAAWTLASRSHSSHTPGSNSRSKKSSTERDPSSSPKQKEHKTWKGKVADTFKRYGSGTAATGGTEGTPSEEVTGTFGIPLELLPPALANEFVPLIVETCTRVVEEKGLDNQGIYRVPGNSGALNAMIEDLNKDPQGLCTDSEKWQDINLVSSMLKMFFRKLPDPLITDELYEAVVTANRTENSERRMLKLKKLIHDLPEHNFETMKFLAQHLNKVASHEEINKMDAHNLAIVFGPTLVRPQDDTMVVMVRDMADQCRVVESIIVHCDWFFSSWDEDVYVPVDEELEDANPISGMNQELLAKAERLDFQHLPRDSRCREIVSSFLQAANRKIRSQRKRRKDVLELSNSVAVNEECPLKKLSKSSTDKDSRGPLRRYLSERRITTRPRTLTVRNCRSQVVLREAHANVMRHPVCPAKKSESFGTENVGKRLSVAPTFSSFEQDSQVCNRKPD